MGAARAQLRGRRPTPSRRAPGSSTSARGRGCRAWPWRSCRPDLEVHLVEPMLRRTEWLTGVVAELGLESVTVHRGRAEELAGTVSAPFVTARAVARLDKLARWCVPLLEPGRHPRRHEGKVGRRGARAGPARPGAPRAGRRPWSREHGGDGARRAGAHRGPAVRAEARGPADPARQPRSRASASLRRLSRSHPRRGAGPASFRRAASRRRAGAATQSAAGPPSPARRHRSDCPCS